ncbi:complement factor B-like [Cloeon dipterum]|uniref:complement factor B-like n=1 Tax=Cloeon dipterum TaxID=197152 RepID=UPI0032209045
MRRGLLVLLSLSVCCGQKAKSEDYIPAPYFDEDENLSVKDCANETSLNHWAVSVRSISSTSGYDIPCPGIAISQKTVLLRERLPFLKSSVRDLRVFFGHCWQSDEEECIKNSIKVKKVIDVGMNSTAQFVHYTVLRTEEMPTQVTPLCLFNRDNAIDLKRNSPYFEWKLWLRGGYADRTQKNVTSQSECLTNQTENQLEILKEQHIPTKNILCLKDHDEGSSNILVNLYKGRYFLRGTKFGTGNLYIDILPYIYEIASNAEDISALHSIPQSIPRKRFQSPDDKLSFPNCGIKRRTRRTKRDLDDDSPVPLIVNGSDAEEKRHPWHAFIYIENSDSTSSQCGGTLISPRAVLTAAHCINGTEATDIEVTVGMYNKINRTSGDQNRTPSRLLVHPDYNSNLHYDIGLMIFDEPFKITDKVHPICLWNNGSNLDHIAGRFAVAVGFGFIADYSLPDDLQEAQLPIKSHKDCYLTSDRKFYGKYLWPGDNFCAGYLNGTSTCNGDSGGSLSLKRLGRWYIRGIVSFGYPKIASIEGNPTKVCHPQYYSLFTDVASYINWIVDNTPDISFKKTQ